MAIETPIYMPNTWPLNNQEFLLPRSASHENNTQLERSI